MTSHEIKEKIEKAVIDYCIRNRNFVIGWDIMSDEDREHVYNIAISVVHTRDGITPTGGGFVQSVVANDLEFAVTRADEISARALKLFVMVKNWCFPLSSFN